MLQPNREQQSNLRRFADSSCFVVNNALALQKTLSVTVGHQLSRIAFRIPPIRGSSHISSGDRSRVLM